MLDDLMGEGEASLSLCAEKEGREGKEGGCHSMFRSFVLIKSWLHGREEREGRNVCVNLLFLSVVGSVLARGGQRP